MATRKRPGDRGDREAREVLSTVRGEIRSARIGSPVAGAVILVLGPTAQDRHALVEHPDALRGLLPLDRAAIARELRRGRVPAAGGITLA